MYFESYLKVKILTTLYTYQQEKEIEKYRYFVCLHYINIVLRKITPFLNVCFLKILQNSCHATVKYASENHLATILIHGRIM
jgi:hypothetical protein